MYLKQHLHKASTTIINQETLYISFQNCQVAIHSNIAEVLAEVKQSFQSMLEPKATRIVGELQLFWANGEYHLLGGSEGRIHNGTLNDVLDRLKYEAVLKLIQARPDLLWLHAGAAAYQDRAVVFSGLSGRGKSTLVTSLYAKGWTYLSDDVLPLDLDSAKVLPFPRTPEVRENRGLELSAEQVQELNKIVVNLTPDSVCRKPMQIAALVFPTYSLRSPTEILPYSPATAALELLQNCLNFVDRKESAVGHVCQLIQQIPVFRLSFSNGDLATETIGELHKNLSGLSE